MKRVVQCLCHTSHLAITYFRDGNVFSSEKNTATVWEAVCYPLDWNKDDVTDVRLETILLHDGVLRGNLFIYMNGGPIS